MHSVLESMCPLSESSYLRLIEESLRPFADLGVGLITEAKEKEVLIALSLILNEVQRFTHETGSLDDMVLKTASTCEFAEGGSQLDHEDKHCLSKIIGDLIVLLAVGSQFVRHLAGNVLVAISAFLAASGSKWNIMIHMLCVVLGWAISTILSDHSAPLRIGAEILDYDSACCIAVLKSRLKSIDWLMVAGIVRVLHNILKYLDQEDDFELLKVFLQTICSYLSSPNWELLNFQRSTMDALHLATVGKLEPVSVFLGHIVQFFCTLVDRSVPIESVAVYQEKDLVLCKINNLIPTLLYWCLGQNGDCNNSCIPQYFRHKILLPLVQSEYVMDSCLEGSPFLLSFSEGAVPFISSRHLQRQTVLFFLRCCISLIDTTEGVDKRCLAALQNRCFEENTRIKTEYSKKGLLELYEWVQGHLPANNMFVGNETYIENCARFSMSFLQLFLHEDNILFEVLLQLHTLPPFTEQWDCKERKHLKLLKEDMLFLLWNLFNPVHLFHLFLSELCYDHLVLLDYLISKDTGVKCAEYLLRSLRAVCDSWHLFVEFPQAMYVLDQSSHKRTDLFVDSITMAMEPSTPIISEEHGIEGMPFQEAKHCLLMLKESLVNLHQKRLFPYNPEALLRRLARFEELCVEDEKCTKSVV